MPGRRWDRPGGRVTFIPGTVAYYESAGPPSRARAWFSVLARVRAAAGVLHAEALAVYGQEARIIEVRRDDDDGDLAFVQVISGHPAEREPFWVRIADLAAA